MFINEIDCTERQTKRKVKRLCLPPRRVYAVLGHCIPSEVSLILDADELIVRMQYRTYACADFLPDSPLRFRLYSVSCDFGLPARSDAITACFWSESLVPIITVLHLLANACITSASQHNCVTYRFGFYSSLCLPQCVSLFLSSRKVNACSGSQSLPLILAPSFEVVSR